MPTLVSLHQPSELKVSCSSSNAFQPGAYDLFTLAYLPGSGYILAHVQMLRYLHTYTDLEGRSDLEEFKEGVTSKEEWPRREEWPRAM